MPLAANCLSPPSTVIDGSRHSTAMPLESVSARSALFNNCHDFASKALNNAEGGARWHTARIATLVFLQGRHIGAASGW